MSPAVSSGWRGGRASSLFLFDSSHEFVARMSVVVCLGKCDGIASRLFLLNSGKELVAKINHVVCPGKRGGIATGLFHLNGGSELVARMGLAVYLGKRGGRASSRFRINGNPGRARSFRASFALAALHIHTILPQRLETELSAAPESAPIAKEDKIFLARRV